MNSALSQRITIGSLLKFTLPSIAMMVIMSLYTVVDGIFVSRLVNTDAFSAVNIMYPLLSFVIALGTMFGTGITAIASIKLGEGRHQEARENVTFVILFSIAVGIVISIFCFAFLDRMIILLGANAAIYDYCWEYTFPLIFFLPANILQSQFQSLFVANGKPQIGLTIILSGGVANVILDYFFIAVCGMGISGAAIATGIGYCIPAIYGICYFTWNRKASLCFVKPKANWRMLLRVMANGSSEMVSNLSGCVTTFLFNIIMMHFIGQDGVAAISILLYLDFMLIAINLGYSIGISPLISYNYGAGNRKELKKLYKLSRGFCILIGTMLTVGTLIFSQQLAAVFAAKGTIVYELAASGLVIYAFSYLFKGYNIFASAMFTAFGNGKVSAILAFLRTLVFLVLSLIGLSALFGVEGVWYAGPLAEILAFILSIIFIGKFKKVYGYI